MNSSFLDISRQQAQQSYMDLHGLQNIRKNSGDDKELGLRQVAQQFEAMFIQMMLKSMRSANEVFGKDNPLNSFESDTYRDMYDNQLSISLSGKGLGIADAFYRQMSRNYMDNAVAGLQGEDGYTVPEHGHASQPFFAEFAESAGAAAQPYNPQVSSYIPQRIIDAALLNKVNSPDDFVRAVTPYAKQAATELGVDYRVLIAQSALETGWGEHIIRDKYGNQSFNLFNIKADKRWDGKSVSVPTLEYYNGVAKKEQANFRRYGSIAESFQDYLQFLHQPRYQKALESNDNPVQFVDELQKAGYATDPNYSKKIQRILNNGLLPKL